MPHDAPLNVLRGRLRAKGARLSPRRGAQIDRVAAAEAVPGDCSLRWGIAIVAKPGAVLILLARWAEV